MSTAIHIIVHILCYLLIAFFALRDIAGWNAADNVPPKQRKRLVLAIVGYMVLEFLAMSKYMIVSIMSAGLGYALTRYTGFIFNEIEDMRLQAAAEANEKAEEDVENAEVESPLPSGPTE